MSGYLGSAFFVFFFLKTSNKIKLKEIKIFNHKNMSETLMDIHTESGIDELGLSQIFQNQLLY